VIVVTSVAGRVEDRAGDPRRIEWVLLDFEGMARGHQRARSDAGTELAISLPRGARLSDGDILHVDAERVIAVRAADEDALVITPGEPMEWGLVGFQLGNRHCASYFQREAILVPYDHTLEAFLRDLGVPFRRERRPLVGIRARAHAH
jgi:urease accessory protein